jgi:uncharacterized protein YjiS (DUF1127 family)
MALQIVRINRHFDVARAENRLRLHDSLSVRTQQRDGEAAGPRAILREIHRVLALWGERRRSRAALRELCALDDHALSDIGLIRGALVFEASKPFWRRPTPVWFACLSRRIEEDQMDARRHLSAKRARGVTRLAYRCERVHGRQIYSLQDSRRVIGRDVKEN